MGLDMYLERFPRYKGTTAKEINAVESLIDYEGRGSEYSDMSFSQYTCYDEDDLPMADAIEFYRKHYSKKFLYGDVRHEYGFNSISENVGYWRKANQIHGWFVENIQDGEDDCQYHREVTEKDIIKLHNTCIAVLMNSKLVPGDVVNGYHLSDKGKKEPFVEAGKVIEDPSVAEKLLPVQDGFFFGNDGYNQYYIRDLEETVKICDDVLASTNFHTHFLAYRASW